jgi:hypothetical protein
MPTPRKIWFRRRSKAEIAAFAEAWLALTAASVLLKALPFERVMRARPPSPRRELAEGEIDRLVWAIDAARRRSWLRAVCIESALALRAMLRRRGVASTLHYGIRNDEAEGLQAHVWLSLGARILIGGETADQFAEVVTFDLAAP